MYWTLRARSLIERKQMTDVDGDHNPFQHKPKLGTGSAAVRLVNRYRCRKGGKYVQICTDKWMGHDDVHRTKKKRKAAYNQQFKQSHKQDRNRELRRRRRELEPRVSTAAGALDRMRKERENARRKILVKP